MNQFSEISCEELREIDGGAILTTGAIIALCLFGGGCVIGVGWALCG